MHLCVMHHGQCCVMHLCVMHHGLCCVMHLCVMHHGLHCVMHLCVMHHGLCCVMHLCGAPREPPQCMSPERTWETMASVTLLFSIVAGGTTRGEVYIGDWGS